MPLTEITMLTIAVMHTVLNGLEEVVKSPEILFPTKSELYILDAVFFTSNEICNDN